MKTIKAIIIMAVLIFSMLQKVNGQSQANCNNLSLDTDTFYLTYQPDTTLDFNLIYMDTTYSYYPLNSVILSDTSIINTTHMSSTFMLHFGDTLPIHFLIHFKTANFTNATVVNGFFHILDCDSPPDTIVNCHLPITIILKNTTGINSTEEESKIEIYPNPTPNELTIRNNENQPIQFTLYNSLGVKIIDETLTEKASKINISSYSSDIYFYRVNNDKRLIMSGKIIKQ
jgi:hypothetical protein